MEESEGVARIVKLLRLSVSREAPSVIGTRELDKLKLIKNMQNVGGRLDAMGIKNHLPSTGRPRE